MQFRKLFSVLFFVTLLATQGCAVTKVTSFKDPEYSAGKTYSKIAILAPLADLDARSDIERAFAVRLRANGVSSTPSIEIIPPTRKPTNDEIELKLQEGGFDALLLVELTDSYRENIYTPGYATTLWGKSGAITTYSGGSAISKPRAKFRLLLIDMSSHQNVWVSSTFTGGNAFATRTTVITSLADTAVNKLKEDRLIKTMPEKAPPENNSK